MLKKLLCIILSCITVVAMVGCGGGATTVSNEGAALPHFNGLNEDGSYDSSVFYRNDLTIFGGDSDVIYVPEERDPVYGGYYYQYTSGNGGVYTQWFGSEQSTFGVSCLRSKDLNDWELCGAFQDGFAVEFRREDWGARNYVWAPEADYDKESKLYFMYFSAQPFLKDGTDPDKTYQFEEKFQGAIYCSESPVGPFRPATSEFYRACLEKNGSSVVHEGNEVTAKNPPIDIARYFGLKHHFSIIDLSPFIDENGDLYMYFSKHWVVDQSEDANGKLTTDVMVPSSETGGEAVMCRSVLSIWCMKMKDFITPDYESLRMVAYPGYKSVEYRGGETNDSRYPIYKDSSYKFIGYDEDENADWDGDINEGAQMLVHTGEDGVKRYYLTYSQYGYDARDYGVHQAVSTSPFGPFVKSGRHRSAVGVNVTNDFMTGVGHHCYVSTPDDELICVYWVHADPFDVSTAQHNGRVYAIDKQYYSYDNDLGYDILYGNGPTKSLMPALSSITGLMNIAGDAKITATNGNDQKIKWLNDGLYTALEYYKDREFEANGGTVITLKFDQPRSIRGIMVFNSYDYNYAFSQVDNIVFTLSEKPAWYGEGEFNGKMYIKDLLVNPDYYSTERENEFMRQGGSALASFNEIKVSEIKLAITKKIASDTEGGNKIRISDIFVLGK